MNVLKPEKKEINCSGAVILGNSGIGTCALGGIQLKIGFHRSGPEVEDLSSFHNLAAADGLVSRESWQ